jgi:glycosyltransferase involved in cell wall biosynthesis
VLVEALACGSAICCSRNDASLAFVRDGENGLLFPPGDVGELLAQMRRLLQNENLIAHIRTNAKRWFEEEGQSLLPKNAFTEVCELLDHLAVPS